MSHFSALVPAIRPRYGCSKFEAPQISSRVSPYGILPLSVAAVVAEVLERLAVLGAMEQRDSRALGGGKRELVEGQALATRLGDARPV